MAAVYGAMLTAWSAAGIAGPQLAAILKDHCGPDAAKWTFGIAAIVLACGWGGVVVASFHPPQDFDLTYPPAWRRRLGRP